MNIQSTRIKEVKLLSPQVYEDDRGFFFESYNDLIFKKETALGKNFVQDNHSQSCMGTLRGLHYQLPPKAQGKLIRVIKGEIFDVAVDIRKNSKTFGQWIGINLSEKNKKQLWIPEGFAHGFLTLSDNAECLYKTTDFYEPTLERGIKWNDKELNIKWPLITSKLILSEKDKQNMSLKNAELF